MIRPVLAGRGQIGGALATGRAASAVLILDEFTAANGTNIVGRAPSPTNTPGSNWAEIGGASWTINGNVASKSGGGGENFLTIDTGDADVTVTCDVTVGNSGQGQGLCLRISDSTHYWILSWSNSNTVLLAERNGGGLLIRATVALTLTPGTAHEFKLVASGATITAYVDGVQVLTYGSATNNQTVTKHGLWVGGTSLPTWDNFKVMS